ncbi:deoxyribodipyrimidine photo-lyase [soil metagenome]
MANPEFDTAIHWFRRDLRLTDNTALHHARRSARQVVPAYITSDWKREHSWTGPNRQAFLCGCLASLDKNIREVGGRLVFRQGRADDALEKLIRDSGAQAVFLNRDPDPFGTAMETKIRALCNQRGIAFRPFKDVVLHERDELLTQSGTPYRVFTPYFKVWDAARAPDSVPRVKDLSPPSRLPSDGCPTLQTWELPNPSAALLAPGERSARQRLKSALQHRIPQYHSTRDTPGDNTTSRLSQDLRFGLVSVREVVRRTKALPGGQGTSTFLTEIAWRDFYMAVLAHFPEVLDREFNPQWRGLPWDDDEERFDRWAHGQTGFPIVDAGMRQLAATGFMHNRLRMVVSMFLTKDLHHHWMRGESHFMQLLVDGEIASNNGGWQWSAGTGADAAPYFRIQNPWTQSARHDPHGEFIKRWIPELKDVHPSKLASPPVSGSLAKKYPSPMVDHARERARTLAIFNRHRAR